ncbi:MAG TPA: ABC transporter permease [Candidatus Saccharibacteria bacterium]|nr:ABC transporter permease [Candidatus Saccharibacteria bacterium]
MIRLGDAAILAATKLRTRKIRTVVTAVLASLLFAVLVFAFTVIQGAVSSYVRYSENGLSNRYITSAYSVDMNRIEYDSPELVMQAKERHKQIVEQKKADAKRLGLPYDPTNEPPAVQTYEEGGKEQLNLQSLAAQQVSAEAFKKLPTNFESAKAIATRYNPIGVYTNESFGDTNGLVRMKGGKESFEIAEKDGKNDMAQPGVEDTLPTLSYLPRTIVDPFLLQGADLSVVSSIDATIPVIVPYQEAETILGLTPLTKTATAAEQLARIDDVKQRAANLTLDVCYRNSSSKQLVEQAKQQIAEIERRKNDKTFEMPSQIYALPDETSCGPVIVAKDTRSTAEKRFMAKQTEFNVKYGLEILPVQKKITLRVVGLSPNTPDYNNFSTLDSLAMMIGGSSLRGQWVIPAELVESSIRDKFLPSAGMQDLQMSMFTGVGALIEFSNAADTRKFMTEQSCNGYDCRDKLFISYFGSNSVLIEDMMTNATRALQIGGAVVSVVAAVLMMGMVGRVITDSRRETAVFRAIGAKRNDIRAVYTIYVTVFALIIAASALAIGTLAAWILSTNYSDSMTTSARLMFIESSETTPFTLVGWWPEAVGLLVGLVVFVGLTAMLLPLSRNLVRSPLKDMRDE